MTKRHWFYLTGGIVALTVIASALLWLNSSKQYQKANILQHIASRTSCLIKIEELTSYMAAMDTLAYAHEFESVFFAETDTSVRQHIIAEIAKQPNLRNFIQRPIYISYHSTKDSAKQNALITIKLNKQAEKKALESIASTLQNEKLSIAGNSIHKFNIARGKTLYGSISKGILYLSQSIELINQSINLPVDESLSADTQFMELFRTM